MKSIYKIFGTMAAAALALTAVSCNDLSDLEQRVDSLEGRIAAVEAQIAGLNANIEAISAFAEGNLTISSATQNSNDGSWTLVLSDNRTITINQGSVGTAPVVSLDKDNYWMVDYGSGAQYITVNGEKVCAGVVPVFGVDSEGYWTVSYDGGTPEKILGADGQPVSALGDENAASYFSEVTYNETDGTLEMTLQNGQKYALKVVKDFICAIEGVDYGTSIVFEPGMQKTYNLTVTGAENLMAFKPEGWTAIISENAGSYTLSVTAPATGATKAVIADSRTDVSVMAISSDGYTAMAKMRVELTETPVEATAAVALVSDAVTASSLTYTVTPSDVTTSWSYIHQLSSEAAPTASSEGWTAGSETTLVFNELTENTAYTLYVLPYRNDVAGTIASAEGTTPVAPITSYYEAFMAGKDIEIGGIVYNKSQFTDEHIYHHTEGTLAHGTQYNNFIIFADAGTNITLGGTTNVVIVGDSPDSKPTITMSSSRYLTPSSGVESRLILKNIAIVPAAGFTNYMFTVNQNYDAQGAFGNFTMDNCDITMTSAAFYSISAARYLDKFVMQNCKVNVPAGTSNRFILHTASATNVFSEITFKDNIFYCPDGVASGFRLLSGATNETNATTVGSVTVENNTFVNVPHTNTSMIIANSFTSVTIKKNLVFANVTSNNNARVYMFANTYPTTAQCSDNVVYDTAYNSSTSQPYMRMFYDNTQNGVLGDNPTALSENPFDGGTFSLSTGEFVPNATYSSYGAQR